MAKRRRAAVRACITPGEKYQLNRGKGWRKAYDVDWAVLGGKTRLCGKKLGARRIDGQPVIVVKAAGRTYAQASWRVK
jgi:hypothetical protein